MRAFVWLLATVLQLFAVSGNAYIINEFNLASGCGFRPYGIAAAPNGDIWYSCPNQLQIVRFRYAGPQGAISADTFVLDSPQPQIAEQLAVADDGILWIAASHSIVRYDPATGGKTFIPLPAGVEDGLALTIAADGNIWFTTFSGHVGRVTPGGTLSAFAIPGTSRATNIGGGPDGNVWFTDELTNFLSRVTPQGVITRFDIGTSSDGVTAGVDGNLWVGGYGRIYKVSTSGQVLAQYTTIEGANLQLRTAPDGTMWYANLNGRIGQITIAGNVSEAALPDPNTFPTDIAIRKTDGMVFFVTNANSASSPKVGAVLPAALTPADTNIIEFFNTILGHYFITGFALEAAAIDNGAAGPGWVRTDKTWKGWLGGPIPNAAEVCRFYGSIDINPATGVRRGPNSHFYTLEPAECAAVQMDLGWTYEPGNRFWLVKPLTGPTRCSAGTIAVYRAYNNGFAQNDSNHRYATDVAIYNQMLAMGWSGEGIVMCAPV
jgi:streptogramin lyase